LTASVGPARPRFNPEPHRPDVCGGGGSRFDPLVAFWSLPVPGSGRRLVKCRGLEFHSLVVAVGRVRA